MDLNSISFPEQQITPIGYLYEAMISGTKIELFLTTPEWFDVFLSGSYLGKPIQWIQMKGQPGKRVAFLENQ